MSNKSLTHFPTQATLKDGPRHVKKYRKSLDDLHGEFCQWFSDFEKTSALQELQLIDLQSNSVLKEKFTSHKLDEFNIYIVLLYYTILYLISDSILFCYVAVLSYYIISCHYFSPYNASHIPCHNLPHCTILC